MTHATNIHRATLTVAALAVIAVTTLVGLTTRSWIGQTFPGFFVFSNRVVASIGGLDWTGGQEAAIYQHAVVEVDGRRIAGNGDAYRAAAGRPAGSPITYTLQQSGATSRVTVESRVFSASDYWMIFGSYLATGFIYLLAGLLGAWLVSDRHLSRAILLVGGTGGIYLLSAVGIYDPEANLRLHTAAEACFPAAIIYLGIACSRRNDWYNIPVVVSAAWMSCALAVAYQLLLSQAAAYSLVHGACEIFMGIAGIAIGARLIVERARGPEGGPMLTCMLAGVILGLGTPAVVMLLSGISGGRVPVNVCTVTAFLFPLGIGCGVVRERLGHRNVAPVFAA